MAAHYEVWLSRDDGTRLALLDTAAGFEYAIVLHDVGACRVTLPGTFDRTLLAADRRIEVWRCPANGTMALERTYLIRHIVDSIDAAGRRLIIVTGVDGNDLLARRVVAYDAGTAQAGMTDQSDDMCRAIVVDNLGADATAARQVSSTYLTIAAERSAGASMTMAFAWRNVLDVLQDIAQTADAAGTPIYWHMVDVAPVAWEFQTYTGQPGRDHTWPDGTEPVLLGLEFGNLAQPVLQEDYSGEVTYVYGGGQGEGDSRNVQEVEDTARSARSVFGRREAFQDARNEDSDNGVTAAARKRLKEGEPTLRFTASLVETTGTQYGLHWRWGDKVTASYRGMTYDAIIRAVHIIVDGNGKETVQARLEIMQ